MDYITSTTYTANVAEPRAARVEFVYYLNQIVCAYLTVNDRFAIAYRTARCPSSVKVPKFFKKPSNSHRYLAICLDERALVANVYARLHTMSIQAVIGKDADGDMKNLRMRLSQYGIPYVCIPPFVHHCNVIHHDHYVSNVFYQRY